MPYIFNPSTGFYVDSESGDLLAPWGTEIKNRADDIIATSSGEMLILTELLDSGEILLANWYEEIRQEVKDTHIALFILAIGGIAMMGGQEWDDLGSLVENQYGFLGNFRDEIEQGDLSQGQIVNRVLLYGNSAVVAYELASQRTAERADYTEEYWHLDPSLTVEHCVDCVGLNSSGWQPIGTFPTPGDGNTICLTSCRCHKTYR